MKQKSTFSYLWAGQSLVMLADVFYLVAVIFQLHAATGTATLAALVPILRVGAQLVSALVAPLLLDRFRLHRILVTAQAGQTLLMTGLACAGLLWPPDKGWWLLLVFVVAISFLEGWTMPARNSLVPRLVEEEQLVRANGLMSTTDQTVQLVGWAFGGVLVAWCGAGDVLWLAVAFHALSLLSMAFVRDRSPWKGRIAGETGGATSWESMREGWVLIFQKPALRLIVGMEVLEGLAGGVWIGAILLVYVTQVLQRGEAWWGFVNACYLVGTISGGMLVLALSRAVDRRRGLVIGVGALLAGVMTLLFAKIPIPWVALLVCLLMGPPMQAKDIAKRTVLQTSVDAEKLPKVFSAQGTVLYATFGIASFGMAQLVDHLGAAPVFVLSGVLLLLSGMLAVVKRQVFER